MCLNGDTSGEHYSAGGAAADGRGAVAVGSDATAVEAVEWDEAGGRRIGEVCNSVVRGGEEGQGRGRGRPRTTDATAASGSALGKRSVRSARWSAVSRNVYQQVQQGQRGVRYERGEGGGVT